MKRGNSLKTSITSGDNHPESDLLYSTVKRIVDWYEKIGREVMLIIMLGTLLVLGCNIFLRYIFDVSISWALELSQDGYIYIVFIGTAISLKGDSHANVKFLYDRVPVKIRKLFYLVNTLVMLIIVYVLLVPGMRAVIDYLGYRGINLPFLPTSVVYLSIPICGVGILAIVFKEIIGVKKEGMK